MMTLENIDPKEFEDFKISAQQEIDEAKELLEDYKEIGRDLRGIARKVFLENLQDIESGISRMMQIMSGVPATIYIN